MIRMALVTLTVVIALTFALSIRNAAHGMGTRKAALNAVLAD